MIRVRFAPSPTGYLHVGGLRTALYNFLFAKKNNGKFILRIEDTDRNRYVEGAVDNLIDTLNWAGINYDEGPKKEGDFEPYLQSERLDIYKGHAEKLIAEKKAYFCFCSAERLTAVREEQQKKGDQPKYDKYCLKLTDDEIKLKIENGEQHVIRMNVPPDQPIIIDDIIRGRVEFNSDIVDDQVLIKSDGFPTYHLANVVDDHLMNISHVIRGEEWLSSTPKHLLLYEFFKWGTPQFAHLPLLLNADRSKLSKRQGDVAVEDYRSKGYLKEALINFVALLGWTAGDDKEFYSLNELIEFFSLERVNKAGAIFNIEKLNWLNGEHLRAKDPVELLPMLKAEMKKANYNLDNFSDEYLINVFESMKERIQFVHEIIEKSPYFFEAPSQYDNTLIEKRWSEETTDHLKKLIDNFKGLNEPAKDDFESTLRQTADDLKIGTGKLIHPVRLALSGVGQGPGLFDVLFILGKEETIRRLNRAIDIIGKN